MSVFEGSPPDESQQPESQPSVEDMLKQLLAEQQQHRSDVAQLRNELAAARKAPPLATPTVAQNPEELMALRMLEVNAHDYYCPGCGRLYDYRRECHGGPEAGHPPIEVVSTQELLSGDTTQHTPAPVHAV